MEIDEKIRLSHQGDMGIVATAIRLRASRYAAGFKSQQSFAEAVGMLSTGYNNMERARAYPTRDVMRYLYRAHRIDFNFVMNGDFAQLPSDVQDRLFPALLRANNEWDRKQR